MEYRNVRTTCPYCGAGCTLFLQVLDGEIVGVLPDNMEAIVLGPRLADGRATLLLASDNNFNETQRNLFAVFATR